MGFKGYPYSKSNHQLPTFEIIFWRWCIPHQLNLESFIYKNSKSVSQPTLPFPIFHISILNYRTIVKFGFMVTSTAPWNSIALILCSIIRYLNGTFELWRFNCIWPSPFPTEIFLKLFFQNLTKQEFSNEKVFSRSEYVTFPNSWHITKSRLQKPYRWPTSAESFFSPR